MAAALEDAPHLRLPRRPTDEQYVASSIQFSLTDLSRAQIENVIAACAQRGVHTKWFGGFSAAG